MAPDIDRDGEIRRRIVAGDPAGMELLVEGYKDLVRGILVRFVGLDAADDLSQEVFLRAYTNMEGFRGEASLGWWISRIASNCGRRFLKRKKQVCIDIQSVVLEAPTPGPEDVCLQDADRARARRALHQIPGGDREILLLREVLGLSYDDIREKLALAHVGTVKSRLHKARESLRRAWGYRRAVQEGESA